ncbi:hypothetical protein [Plantibacter sp. M259]|uniref:hypothetical protein n=1 Tax=Plantibacter sp. M259 TaxID=2583822 RepID=UPI001110CDD5|nr:hypothetical protein [Plantibacter sp. M259]
MSDPRDEQDDPIGDAQEAISRALPDNAPRATTRWPRRRSTTRAPSQATATPPTSRASSRATRRGGRFR